MGEYQSGQMGQTVNLLVYTFGGSNPSSPTLRLRAKASLPLALIYIMITIQQLNSALAEALASHPEYFAVAAEVRQDDSQIVVEIDSAGPVDVDFCAMLSRELTAALAPASDDYDWEVGSAGLTSPLRVKAQYDKNVGNPLEVFTTDGRKLIGTLVAVSDKAITLRMDKRVRLPERKRPVNTTEDTDIPFAGIRQATCRIVF